MVHEHVIESLHCSCEPEPEGSQICGAQGDVLGEVDFGLEPLAEPWFVTNWPKRLND